jgi:hypothetical protein
VPVSACPIAKMTMSRDGFVSAIDRTSVEFEPQRR